MTPTSPAAAEALESRLLFAVTVDITRSGRLTIIGDESANSIVVRTSFRRDLLQVEIDGALIDPTPSGGPRDGVRRSRVRVVRVESGGGDDVIRVVADDDPTTPSNEGRINLRAVVAGGAGNDTIATGGGRDVILGGAGNDTISCGRNADLVYGGTGDDVIFGDRQRDSLFGQDGNDALDGGRDRDALHGMAGDDSLTGGPGDDLLFGGGQPGDYFADLDSETRRQSLEEADAYFRRLVDLTVSDHLRPEVFA